MDSPITHPDVFVHVRIIIGMVLGLSITRLVTGLARFVQHPKRDNIYPIHFAWVLFLLVTIIHFWWFEFGLSAIQRWTFEIYLFLIAYAILFAFLSAILFPDRMDEYKGYEDYFQSRRKWFYGLLALLFIVDLIDSRIKGIEHFQSLGLEYPIRQAAFATCAIVAIFVSDKRYQTAFVTIGLIYQITWILRLFDVLN